MPKQPDERWRQPPFVAVRVDRKGHWLWEARGIGNHIEEKSERLFNSMQGAVRAAKKVAAKRAWPLVVLPGVELPKSQVRAG